MNKHRFNVALWTLVCVSVLINIASALLPYVMPLGVEAGLLIALPFAFAFAHGSVDYRFSDVLLFAIICFVVSNVSENMSILTGFPFGRYYFTENLGPKLFLVPLVIGPAYFGMGYLSWMLARAILESGNHPRPRHALFAQPVLASFVMVSWDLSIDPLASTLRRAWVWEDGGSYFGVPLSNFLGWYLTVYVFFQLFALYLRARRVNDVGRPEARNSRSYWLQPVVLYGITAVRILLISMLSAATNAQVTDQAGVAWRVHDVFAVCALVCTFTMIPFTILALIRITEFSLAAGQRVSEGPIG